jgi:hypothetical protein
MFPSALIAIAVSKGICDVVSGLQKRLDIHVKRRQNLSRDLLREAESYSSLCLWEITLGVHASGSLWNFPRYGCSHVTCKTGMIAADWNMVT